MSQKQRKVSYSTRGAQILAAADGDDTGYFLKDMLCKLFSKNPLKQELMIDSKSLFETTMMPQKSDDYRLQKIVARMRNSFDSSELNSVLWIPRSQTYADVLTKCNLALPKKLSLVFISGH